MGKLHIMDPSGYVKTVEGVDKLPTSAEFGKLVAGPIEYVRVLWDGKVTHMVVNEVGATEDLEKGYPLQPNARATLIYCHASLAGFTGVKIDPLNTPLIHGIAVLLEDLKVD